MDRLARKRWRLLQAAKYGLLFTGGLLGVGLLLGIIDPQVLSDRSAPGLMAYWLSGAVLFVAIAAIRNARLPRVPRVDEDVDHAWSDTEREQFKRLLDQQKR
jgi:hypothetical protein